MPPEQLPWDRRDFRKHERSASDTRFVNGSGGFGGRWRDHHHPHAPPPSSPHPPPYHHHQNPQQQQRWYSDFRSSRPVSNGHGKQGGWQMYSDEAGHGFPPFGSRHSDRNFEDDSSRSLGYRGDRRYIRNGRDSRGFSHKEWRSPNWELSSGLSSPGKSTSELNDLKSQENTLYHDNLSKSSGTAVPASSLPTDQRSFDLKEKLEDSGGSVLVTKSCQDIVSSSDLDKSSVELHHNHKPVENGPVCISDHGKINESGLAVFNLPLDLKPSVLNGKHEDWGSADGVKRPIQKYEKENTLGSIDRKFLKWSWSGNLSSRISASGNYNSLKTSEGLNIENGADQQREGMLANDSSAAGALVASIAPNSSDNTNSRKKPRLGWGEGLAKYEKKKVEVPENVPATTDLVSISNLETLDSPSMNQLDKSPMHASLPMSPTTPCSVACSFSPGTKETDSIKAVGADQINATVKCSSSILPEPEHKEPRFDLESLDDLSSVSHLSSLISELVQSDDQVSIEKDNVKAASLDKLLMWKVNASKALEMTESEIDSLEVKYRSLAGDPGSCYLRPSFVGPRAKYSCIEPCSEIVNASSFTCETSLLMSSVARDLKTGDSTGREEISMVQKDEKTDSQLSDSLKSVDLLPFKSPHRILGHIEHLDLDPFSSCKFDQMCSSNTDHFYESIISCNKELASKATDDLNKLSGSLCCRFDDSSAHATVPVTSSGIKEKFFMRRRALKFSEKALALKYKVLQHFWKEGRVVSLKKIRGKSHKKFDLSHAACSTNRSSSHSRLLYSSGSLPTVTAEEIVDVVNNYLSIFPFKPCSNTLKMPSLILDRKTKNSRFISNNGLVDDPCAAEKEKSLISPWTDEEREVFIDKLAEFGKDFGRIASFLDQRTIAECIEFYYKNHKSECFSRAKRKSDANKKSHSSMHLLGAGKRLFRDSDAASLDILGEVANANSYNETQAKYKFRISLGSSRYHSYPGVEESTSKLRDNVDFYNNNETAAVDVLAGICGSLSSEAMSSCITSSIDPADGSQDLKLQRCLKRPLTPDITQCIDDECSEESYEEIDSTDWNDEEKSMFIQAVSLYGKDFLMISQFVRTRSRDQCRIFFSKARKCLALDVIQSGASTIASDEGASVMGNDSSVCNIISDEPKFVGDSTVSNGHEPETMFTSSTCDDRDVTAASSNKITSKVYSQSHSETCTSAEELKNEHGENTGHSIPTKYEDKAAAFVNACNGSASNVTSLRKYDFSESMDSSSMLFPVPIEYQGNSYSGVDTMHPQRILQRAECVPCHSPSGRSDDTNIPKAYPVAVMACEELTWDGDRKTQVTLGCKYVQHKRTESSQQFSDNLRSSNDTIPEWFQSTGHNGTHLRLMSSVKVEEDRPFRNGDVKLFGKILVSSEPKPSSVQSDCNGQCHKHEPLNPRTETGFSRILHTKKFSTSSDSTVKTGLPDGPLAFSGKVLIKCNGKPAKEMVQNQGLQPLATNMKQADALRIGKMYDAVNFNSRGIIGGQCSSVSDPSAAMEARSVIVQGGNLVGDEDSWRVKGDVGR